ncbi:apolipoprotein M [Acanthopagrus latus]|uniref:apolipoprotein M n=1 Tax=Acanthopagrus latus TaxID=8177 RepID=UPI00187BF95A|nr:apolipoprotein M [Acanthopagrus latus]
MFKDVLTYVLSLSSFLYQVIVPCSLPEQLFVKTINQEQYLGRWYFQAAVSNREADIQKFRQLDNLWFTLEKTANDTLLLTGHMRMGDDCVNQSWTYHIRPDRDDMILEGRTFRWSLLWSGKWANCPECIILQEKEPPLSPSDSVDSLNRFMLYARQGDVNTAVVSAFVSNAACNNMSVSVTLPQNKEFCT